MSSLIAKLTAATITIAPVDDGVCSANCDLSNSGYALIRTFEGYSPYVYKDSAGLDTIGYGHLIVKGEKFTQPLLPEQAQKLLVKDARIAVNGVNKGVKIPLKQNQIDALISFTYNVGVGAFHKSTLLRRVNAEKHDQVPPQFLRWVRAGGKIIKGLVNRRNAEAELYQL